MFRFVFVPRMTEMERAFLGELGVEDDMSSDNVFGNHASSSGAIPVTGALNCFVTIEDNACLIARINWQTILSA